MSNKLYGNNVSDFLVDGAKDKGYLKNSKKGYDGDSSSGSIINNYNSGDQSTQGGRDYFEGKKGSKVSGGRGATSE